jgi:CDP-diacylglycerol--serine O-phosphatidyltransferase
MIETDQHSTHATPETLPERPRRLLGISLLPAAATLGNLLCGFAAIFCCLLAVRAEYAEFFAVQPRVFDPRLETLFPTHIAAGAYLIVLAMLFDALDGRLARMMRRTSEFGAQLDSIADIVSFGVAPAALIVTLLLRPAIGAVAEEPDVSRIQFRVGMVCALLYLSCAAIRLARYNAENVQSEESQRAFSGLPSPGAAAIVAALLAVHETWRQSEVALLGVDWANVSRWGIVTMAGVAGLLMVSRFDYVHVFNAYLRRRHPPTRLVWLVVLIGVGWFSMELLLVVLALAYMLSGPVGALRHRAYNQA